VSQSSEVLEFTVPGAARDGGDVPENLRVFAGAIIDSAGPTLATVLNRAVALETPTVSRATVNELLTSDPLPWVVAEVPYQRGLTGRHWLIVTAPSAHALASLGPVSGDGRAELDPGGLAAIRDVVDRIFGAAGPTLMPLFARAVAFGPAVVSYVQDRARLPGAFADPAEPLWAIRAHAAGPDGFAADLVLIVDRGVAAEIAALGAAEASPAPEAGAPSKIDLVLDVSLPITVELGRARMQIQDILKLAPGSVIELDKSAGDPVELFINDRRIARGEVVIIDENFGVRLTAIVTAPERLKTLR